MHSIPFDLMLGLASLVYVFGNFVANITGRQWSSVEKQLLAWLAGIVAVMLAAHTDFAGKVLVAGIALSKLNGSSLVFLGLLPPSFGGVIYHFGQRLDRTGSGDVPDLPAPAAAPMVTNVAAIKSPVPPDPATGVVGKPPKRR